jgi:uncharacterized protein (TIGR03118 family)
MKGKTSKQFNSSNRFLQREPSTRLQASPFDKGNATSMTPLHDSGHRFLSAPLWLLATGLLPLLSTPALAQYTVTGLISNQTGIGSNPADPALVNAWGITSLATSPFWVSDNGTGKSTLYNSVGQKQGLVVAIPAAGGSPSPGTPTGVIGNTTGQFEISAKGKSASALFIFATQDGTISGWHPTVDQTHAIVAVDRSGIGASYTALAIASNPGAGNANFVYAADSSSNREIDMFDSNFKFVKSFSDPENPNDLTPYGMREINGKLWVTFTPLNKGQNGLVDVFNLDGTVFKHDAVHGPLHSPWGVALAPANFGPFSNAVLIGNNDRAGRINAFDPGTGVFLGALADTAGVPISINQLWGLDFGKGAGANGATNELFFTAGPDNYANGLFGVITVNP